jgi:hypothetical protein
MLEVHVSSRVLRSPTREDITPLTFIAPHKPRQDCATRIHVRLLGPCFKTGRIETTTAVMSRLQPDLPVATESRVELFARLATITNNSPPGLRPHIPITGNKRSRYMGRIRDLAKRIKNSHHPSLETTVHPTTAHSIVTTVYTSWLQHKPQKPLNRHYPRQDRNLSAELRHYFAAPFVCLLAVSRSL